MNQPTYFGEGLGYVESDQFAGVLIVAEGGDGVGCGTQMRMLREWLELQGYGVIEAKWTQRADLAERIAAFHGTRPIDPFAYCLSHAADFAACLEKEILPALHNGLIVLANRYVYTAWTRNVVRGADPTWVRDVFGFVPVPDLVMYLQLDVNSLAQRALSADRLGEEEVGVDLRLADDVFDGFKKYQTRMIKEFNKLAEEFDFQTISARRSAEVVQEEVRQVTAKLLERRERAFEADLAEALPQETARSIAAHQQSEPAVPAKHPVPAKQPASKAVSAKAGSAVKSTTGKPATGKSAKKKTAAGSTKPASTKPASTKKASTSTKPGKKIAVKSES